MKTMADNTNRFGNTRYQTKKEVKLSNMARLNKTWQPFLETTRIPCWWGNMSLYNIACYLAKKHVAVGAITLAAFTTRTPDEVDSPVVQGGVCYGAVKCSKRTFKLFMICLNKGSYFCDEFQLYSFKCPIKLIKAVRKRAANELTYGYCAYFLPKPNDLVPEEPTGFCGSHVLEELRSAIQTLGDGWWGLSHTSQRAMLEVIEDLQKKKTDECSNPGAALSCVDEASDGYLFTVITSHVHFYKVSFFAYGYLLERSMDSTPKIFPTLLSLLNFACNFEKITFVSRPLQTLQEICRDVLIKRNFENDPHIPLHVKKYLKESPYTRPLGVRKTKFLKFQPDRIASIRILLPLP